MKTYLIHYISLDKGSCFDIQQAVSVFEALILHYRYFPKSKAPIAREL